ncbi:MAG: ribonuclease P protein component [Candidatus Pacebacteria bacterium]|jgi:ribonuclease P protein component|nr:ribonuclease P protein component [Candidatus Paceibacterota bacterium]
MLSKEFRIRKQKDFDHIFGKDGFFCSQDFLALKAIPNGLAYSRFGFIVSNKISKSAVKRNRIKRLLRETVRLRWENINPSFDVVLIARADVSEKSFEDVDKTVDSLLKKSGLLIRK